MAKPAKKAKRAKEVKYELIEPTSDVGRPMYKRLQRIVDAHHEEVTDARIALAWCRSWNPDVDGRVTLGKCKKATDLDRELAPYDFVIMLSPEFWLNARVTDAQREALLDHELMHAAVSYDDDGFPKVDERGRKVYRIRKHDIEEFGDVVGRHGCYKRDLELFAAALERARVGGREWVSATALLQLLERANAPVTPETVAEWTQVERREAREWARLRAELAASGRPALSEIDVDCPAHVKAAVVPKRDSLGVVPTSTH